MANNMITVSGDIFTIDSMRADWADDAYTAAQVTALADAQYAYLINHTYDVLRGWSYTGDGFTGPARSDAVALIMQLMTDSGDYVAANLFDIVS